MEYARVRGTIRVRHYELVNVKRSVVSGLNRACTWLDAVAYRPAVVKLTLRLPRWWRCELAKLSMRLDDRWQTGFWDDGPAAPAGLCDACGRRAAWLAVGGFDERFDDEPPRTDDFLGQHPIHLCGWCRLEPDKPIENAETLKRALANARARSIAWRWS